jgi:AcrR family transcriptional regulator
MPTPRERFRAQMRDDAKRVALAQIEAEGPGALSVNAIGRELGVSGPALYRYFANREALLTELILDAYADLAAATASARSVKGFAAAYRTWAKAQPHRYRLLYAEPTPGYDAHQPALVAAAQVLMAQVVRVLGEGDDRAIRAWWRIHGFVSLEIDGNFASMGVSANRLFDAEVRTF